MSGGGSREARGLGCWAEGRPLPWESVGRLGGENEASVEGSGSLVAQDTAETTGMTQEDLQGGRRRETD